MYTVLQFNTDGIRSSRSELLAFLHEYHIKIAAIQETKLQPTSPPIDFPNYYLLRKDRSPADGGGGLAFLIHDSVPFRTLDTSHIPDQLLEIQGISASINNSEIDILNLYLPPASSCPGHTLASATVDSVVGFSDGDLLVLGRLECPPRGLAFQHLLR